MRKILLIASFLISSICQAQDTLFKIISVKGNVTLNAVPVTCNQLATSANDKLFVPGKAYAIILTEKGFAFKLDSGSYSVQEISNAEYSNIKKARYSNAHHSGAVLRHENQPIIIMAVHNLQSRLLGDSLTIISRPWEKEVSKYRLLISNQFAEALYDSVSLSNVHIAKISDRYGTWGGLIFQVKSEIKKIKSKEYLVTKVKSPDSLAITYDYSCVQESDFIKQKISLLAVCEVYELYLDQVSHLYALWKYSQRTGIMISHRYYQRLIKEYELEKFLPVPKSGY